MRKYLFFGSLMLSISNIATAQKFYNWFSANDISIRKSFDGSKKDEEKPGTFFLARDYEKKVHYTLIDVGVKIKEIDLLGGTGSSFILYPKFEAHEDKSNPDKKKSNISMGSNFEFFPGAVPASGAMQIWFLGSGDYQNDYIKEIKTIKLKFFTSLFGNAVGAPGSSIRNDSNALVFRYYPYVGIERYVTVEESKKSATYLSGRLFFEAWPITSGNLSFVQLTVDASYRIKLSDNLYDGDNMSWLSTGLNIYPDGYEKIGFGLEYSVGDDAGDNFSLTNKLLFGIKIKL